MPTTQPHTNPQITPERLRTGIIVSVVVCAIAILALGYVMLRRRINRGVKEGKIRRRCDDEDPRVEMVDKEVEMGVVREPLPVYVKDVRGGEKSVGVGGEGWRG
ncbi:hypothetical protein HBH64_222720 [Parastagonospora nodorum]|nr:hypothetical protein HBH53_071510 [Parastagonospora nodorum]KAH3959721.1 hypothetical protein HBH51_196380 [Parastagonospora nodorum]KAH3974000.1 hypothetical protein HBH52_140290 [Parastagonospora nodorum]KAH3998533.1 hypothetical protein HBI10_127250 [Parastagonospora nodorum]KAH4024045.1 hypothetical protein HBI13_082290 [Parastagonospora nodorum]